METKELTDNLLNTFKEIEGVEFVDLYYSRSDDKINVPKYPAILFNVADINYEQTTSSHSSRMIEFGALLCLNNVNSNIEKELSTLELLDRIFFALKKTRKYNIQNVSCIERTSSITIYYLTIMQKEIISDYKEIK